MIYHFKVKTSYHGIDGFLGTGGTIEAATPQKAIEQIKKDHLYLIDDTEYIKSICLYEYYKLYLVYVVLFGEEVC